ncbi:MAG: hypothetical protein HQ446_12610, partial [Polaromonas sp.]|nr:hypothetical protein [Polaromonas sp.]
MASSCSFCPGWFAGILAFALVTIIAKSQIEKIASAKRGQAVAVRGDEPRSVAFPGGIALLASDAKAGLDKVAKALAGNPGLMPTVV